MTAAAHAATSPDLWIFGYGSLMWRPGFVFDRAEPARLTGFRRCFCIYSTHHRGSGDRPGLVLGLDRGGTCDGIAYRVPNRDAQATLAYLRAREQVNGVYREALVQVELHAAPRELVAVRAYVVERSHPSYTGPLPLAVQARLIRAARGISGYNLDYLINTLLHLRELGLREPSIERLLTLSGPHFGRLDRDLVARPGVRALRQACQAHPVEAPRLRPWQRRRFVHRKQIAAFGEMGRGTAG